MALALEQRLALSTETSKGNDSAQAPCIHFAAYERCLPGVIVGVNVDGARISSVGNQQYSAPPPPLSPSPPPPSPQVSLP